MMDAITAHHGTRRPPSAKSFRLFWRRLFFFSSRRRHTRFDCSSDVCSSDLVAVEAQVAVQGGEHADPHGAGHAGVVTEEGQDGGVVDEGVAHGILPNPHPAAPASPPRAYKIGRASCRERV